MAIVFQLIRLNLQSFFLHADDKIDFTLKIIFTFSMIFNGWLLSFFINNISVYFTEITPIEFIDKILDKSMSVSVHVRITESGIGIESEYTLLDANHRHELKPDRKQNQHKESEHVIFEQRLDKYRQ